MDPRECFPLGRGLATLTPSTEAPSDRRPFGMRQAVTLAPAIADDADGLAYDPVTQTLTLTNPTGDPERDRLLITMKSNTQRATDRDSAKPTTPKDLNTDSD